MNSDQKYLIIGVLTLAAVSTGYGQTQVDLKTQTKEADFSAALRTRPFKTGTQIPAACTVGEMFFKSDAASGQNVFGCTATNIWSLQTVANFAGDVSGPPQTAVVSGLQGRPVASAAPADGQALVWSSTNANWSPQAVASGGGGGVTTNSTSQLADMAPTISGATLTAGAICSVSTPCRVRFASHVYRFSAPVTATITAGSGTGTARLYISEAGVIVLEVPSSTATTITGNGIVVQNVLSPSYPANSIPVADAVFTGTTWTTVTDNRAYLTGSPMSAGTGVIISSTTTATHIDIDSAVVPMLGASNVYTGDQLSHLSTKTAPNKIGASDPAACDATVKETFFNTSSNTLKICTATNTWTPLGGLSVGTAGQGYFIVGGAPNAGTATATTANVTYFFQFTLPFAMTVRSMNFALNGGGAGTEAAAFALYDSTCTKIANSDVRKVGVNSTGAVSVALASPLSISGGTYYLGFATDSPAASFASPITSIYASLLNQTGSPRLFAGNPATGTGASLVTAASCGTATAGNSMVPVVSLLP